MKINYSYHNDDDGKLSCVDHEEEEYGVVNWRSNEGDESERVGCQWQSSEREKERRKLKQREKEGEKGSRRKKKRKCQGGINIMKES